MPRASNVYSRTPTTTRADDEADPLPGAQRRVVRTPANIAPPLKLAPGAVASVFEAGKQAKAENGRGRHRLPAIDPAQLQVHEQLAPPFGCQLRGRTKYDVIFDRLTADGMAVTGIPRAYYGGLCKAIDKAKAALPAGSKYLVRTLDSHSLGVFRVTDAGQDLLVGRKTPNDKGNRPA